MVDTVEVIEEVRNSKSGGERGRVEVGELWKLVKRWRVKDQVEVEEEVLSTAESGRHGGGGGRGEKI